jgi:hypothetical protein
MLPDWPGWTSLAFARNVVASALSGLRKPPHPAVEVQPRMGLGAHSRAVSASEPPETGEI